MFKSFMKAIGRHRVIYDREDNEPYLERYYLFLKDRVTFPFNIFLHKFYKSDPDDLHDHPWNYITFIVKGGLSSAKKVLEKLEVFTLAESLGGAESLAEHPAIMTHASIPKDTRESLGIDDGLIR